MIIILLALRAPAARRINGGLFDIKQARIFFAR
jgi:hypothetical protein